LYVVDEQPVNSKGGLAPFSATQRKEDVKSATEIESIAHTSISGKSTSLEQKVRNLVLA